MIKKILHTGDWHLGISELDIDRKEEQKEALNYLLDVAEKEKIDYILNNGDIVHYPAPPNADLTDRIMQIFSRMGKIAKTFIIEGNHCWKGYRAFNHVPLNVKFINSDEIYEDEDIRFFMKPYFDIKALLKDQDSSTIINGAKKIWMDYFSSIEDKMDSDKVNIFAGHLSLTDMFYTGSGYDGEILIPPEVFPENLNIITLSHIHDRKKIEGIGLCNNIWYSGSIIRNNFGESKSKTGFVIYEINTETKEIKATEYDTPAKELITINYDIRIKSVEEIKVEITKELELNKNAYYKIVVNGNVFPGYIKSEINILSEKIIMVELRKEKTLLEIEKEKNIIDLSKCTLTELYKNYVTALGISEERINKNMKHYEKYKNKINLS